MLLWLASYPRSGNTFFRYLLYQLYSIRSYGIDFATSGLITGKLMPASPELSPAAIADAAEPFFVKTHRLPGLDGYQGVYLVRDGRDALVSYAHFTLTYDRGVPPADVHDDVFRATLRDLLLEPSSHYGSWGTNVDAWTRRPHTIVVTYEELISRPLDCLRRVVETLQIPVQPTGQPCPTFAHLHAVEPCFFRRGQVGDWQNEFPPDLLEIFWDRFGGTMRRLGYGAKRAAAA